MTFSFQNKLANFKKNPKQVKTTLLAIIGLVVLLLGVGSVVIFQNALQFSSDNRNHAATKNGIIDITSSLGTGTSFISGQPTSISLYANTHNAQTNGVQLDFVVQTSASSVTVDVPASSSLQAVFKKITPVTGGYEVAIILVPIQLSNSFSSASPYLLAHVVVSAIKPETITLTFDQTKSISTIFNSNPVQDQLNTVPAFSYTLTGPAASPSPSPSSSPATSPSVSPSASPSVRPSPSPSPSASPSQQDQLFFTSPAASSQSLIFYQNNAQGAQVPPDQLVPGNVYYVTVSYQIQNQLKLSSEPTTPIIITLNVNGAVIATSSLAYNQISSNTTGTSGTLAGTFIPQQNDTFTLSFTAPASLPVTATNNKLTWQYAYNPPGLGRFTPVKCNGTCRSNADCDINLLCNSGQCRLALNPSSSTCAAPPNNGLQRTCNQYCANTAECTSGLTCYYNSCRLPNNVTDSSCLPPSANTATPIAYYAPPATPAVPTTSTSPGAAIPPNTPLASGQPPSIFAGHPVPSPSTPVNSPSTSPSPDIATEPSTSAQILANLRTRLGALIPAIIVLLLVLFLIAFLVMRRKKRPPQEPPMTNQPPETPPTISR